ncbi:MAG: alkaline phosphatase family protein [Chloroflexota bacterium]
MQTTRREFLKQISIGAASLATAWMLSSCRTVGLPAPAVPTPTSNLQPPTYLVLISIDACRPEYLDLAPLPNLQKLMDNGISYSDAWVGALVSNTPPGHTEMSTGTFPKTNGILSFTWKNSETGATTDPTSLEAINNGDMARIVEKNGVPTIAGLVKAQTPDAIVAAVTAHKYYAAQGMGMGPTDFIVYAHKVPRQNPKAKQPTPTPERAYEPAEGSVVPMAIKGHEPSADVMNDRRLNITYAKRGDENTFAINAALVLFEKYRPRALLINLPETDGLGHQTGGLTAPDKFRELMIATDAQIGRLMDAYRAAGIFDQTLWVVTADHGMIPNSHAIDTAQTKAAARAAGVQGGGGLNTYLAKPAQAPTLAEAIAKKNVDGILGAYAKVKVSDHYEYQPAPTTQAALPPALNDAYLYLLGTYVGATSHDVVLMTKENWTVSQEPPNTHGNHGEIVWGNQHIPLIISGPGIKRGVTSNAPARIVDIAPTIARVMGLAMKGFDGVPLADALMQPSADDIAAQNMVTLKLAPLRDAFKQATTK